MLLSQTIKTAFNIAALVIIAPLFVVFIILPCLAYCAVLDCLGIIKAQRDPVREEIEKWEAQRQQRENLPVSQPDDTKAA